ncbi:MAG TPA: hypothetical protein VGM84_09895 [Steroidobacteraceae bacterium]
MWKRLLRFFATYVVVCAFAVTALFVDTWPSRVRSWREWALLLIVTLPVTELGDWLTDRALSRTLWFGLDVKVTGLKPAWSRIGFSVALCVFFAVCAVGLTYCLQYALS